MRLDPEFNLSINDQDQDLQHLLLQQSQQPVHLLVREGFVDSNNGSSKLSVTPAGINVYIDGNEFQLFQIILLPALPSDIVGPDIKLPPPLSGLTVPHTLDVQLGAKG